MKNIESTPPSLSNPLAGVSVYPELIAIEPWSTPDPEVRAYFEASDRKSTRLNSSHP